MKKITIYLLLINSLVFLSCNGQNGKNLSKNLNDYNYEESVLSEDEMIATSEKAIELIKNNQLKEFRELFAEEISKDISDDQLSQLITHLNLLFQKEGVPSGEDNVVPAIQASINRTDTLFINKIMYNYEPTETEPYSKILSFSFLKKHGTKKLAGINLGTDGQKGQRPTIEKLDKFLFNIDDVKQFRIYYDEGKQRKTKFKNEIGFFAIEGDLNTLNESGIRPIIVSIFEDLEKSKFEKVEAFNTSLDRGMNPSFIQIEIMLKDKPYLVFLYLPIKDDGTYSDQIIFMQKEYANLGYKYVLKQSDYKTITNEFPKIGKMNLEEFYHDNP